MTLTWGSILKMKIRSIKANSDDVSLAIPSSILVGLNKSVFSINLSNAGSSGKLHLLQPVAIRGQARKVMLTTE